MGSAWSTSRQLRIGSRPAAIGAGATRRLPARLGVEAEQGVVGEPPG